MINTSRVRLLADFLGISLLRLKLKYKTVSYV